MATAAKTITRTTELRHLPGSHKDELAKILDPHQAWQKLMEHIPANLSDLHRNDVALVGMKRKYTREHIG